MLRLGMIEYTGEKRMGHKCGRMQLVRRALPEPHIAKKYEPKMSKKDQLLDEIRKQVDMLGMVIPRLSSAEDRVRVNHIYQRLKGMF